MNKQALTRHNIYNKLVGFSEQDLHAIASFIDFMRYQKRLEGKKLLKLEGILKGCQIHSIFIKGGDNIVRQSFHVF